MLLAPNMPSDKIKIKVMNFGSYKDWWMQMLLHLNEDFDDDLLLDAISLLPEAIL